MLDRGEHLAPVQVEGGPEGALDAVREEGGVGGRADVLQEDDELVAAQARHRVRGAEASGEPSGDVDQELVAGHMAEAVVHHLEPVHVHEEDAELVPFAPARAGDGLAQPVHEEGPVGKAREGVVHGVVEEALLGDLALRDVRLGTGHPIRPALRVAHGEAAGEHPAVPAVPVQDPVLVLEVGRVTPEVCLQPGLEGGEVVGVDAVEPVLWRAGGLPALILAQHGLPAGRVEHAVGTQLPVPEAVVGTRGGQRVAFLARPEVRLSAHALAEPLPRGDEVGDGPVPADDGGDDHLLEVDRPVLLAVRHLPAEGLAPRMVRQKPSSEFGAVEARLEDPRRPSHDLLAGVPREPFEGGVDVEDDTLPVRDDDQVLRLVPAARAKGLGTSPGASGCTSSPFRRRRGGRGSPGGT